MKDYVNLKISKNCHKSFRLLKPIDLKIISNFHPWFLIFFIWMVSELFKYRFVEIFCVTGRFKMGKKWSLKCSFRRCDIINKFLILLISNLENIFKCIKPGLSLRLFQSKDWNHLKWFDQAETNLYLEFFDEFFYRYLTYLEKNSYQWSKISFLVVINFFGNFMEPPGLGWATQMPTPGCYPIFDHVFLMRLSRISVSPVITDTLYSLSVSP